ncbi:response regulator transcription factor [Paenibacillus sp. L3-i20]|uniref:response regulator transcription factor n=1 Tax=Paenibacillus sp. L3-i20 TaxID=2905833 RepID=UPI001EDD50B0|nr:response regulator transcription factor [Paenibacillus sp. L3-i20]GKU75982.1 DNA-binding response regulator [Paenibacillus sp. L3-i20]
MRRILLIEDEVNLARFIELELQHEGFAVTTALDGTTGLELALAEQWDIILLDLMLPGIDGLEVCKRIRKMKQVPILMITARDSITDRVSGLDSGADDYISKPFAIEELLARIRVVFRRQQEVVEESQYLLSCGILRLDSSSRIVSRGTDTIDLTKREFALLEAFMKNINRVLHRETLLDIVWGYNAVVDTNVVDVYVRYLRNKIDLPGTTSYIESVRGIGYVMRK